MNEQIEELFPFYALEALSAEEKAQVDQYVALNPKAQAQLAAMIAAAAFMPYDAPAALPDPTVKTRLMNQVKARPRRAQTAVTPPSTSWWQRLWPLRLNGWPQLRQRPLLPALSGLAILVAVAALGMVLASQNELRAQTAVYQTTQAADRQTIAQLQTEVANQQTAVATLAAQLAERDTMLATLRQQLNQQEGLLALLATPDAQISPIASSNDGAASGQLVFTADGATAVFLIRDLPPLAADQTYQAWFIGHDGRFVNVGQLAQQDQTFTTHVTLPEKVRDFAAVGVSIEQRQGSDSLAQPTEVVMVGPILVATDQS